jgi:very-short-patch-repair endonuclease
VVKEETQRVRDSRQHLRGFAREMRRLPTEAERNFWQMVRGRQLGSLKFKRQFPIGNYIADFVCLDHRLIVEIDGAPHESNRRYDSRRDAFLTTQGFRVLRFWNYEISADIEGVMQAIEQAIDTGK